MPAAILWTSKWSPRREQAGPSMQQIEQDASDPQVSFSGAHFVE